MAAVEKLGSGSSAENNASSVLERLKKRHQTRLEDAERRKEANDSLKPAEESAEYFESEFNRERAAVEALLLRAGPGASRAEAADALERATAELAALQKFVSDSVMFLTQYELSRAQAALQTLHAALNAAREEALPAKKFAFRARKKATGKTPAPPPSADATGGLQHVTTEAEQCEFSHLSDVNITKTAEEIERRDVLVTHLRNCRVTLLGAPSTLHLKDLRGCDVRCGPVRSSVFVDRVTDSTLALACQQLRTHNTTDTCVYLHVTCKAIVEDCARVGFAPFTWSYPGLERDYAASGLDQTRNNWSAVDDFNWLAADTPSPNWSVIPEEERRTTWDT
ncbi:tubulin-specific chaperone C [Eucyclogobius newberryi]|uniref:tubulin-specific chaperone C n=1 Tax=Eucyclogobius newberryi TaxID=166745 RepID=UPI003B5B9232